MTSNCARTEDVKWPSAADLLRSAFEEAFPHFPRGAARDRPKRRRIGDLLLNPIEPESWLITTWL